MWTNYLCPHHAVSFNLLVHLQTFFSEGCSQTLSVWTCKAHPHKTQYKTEWQLWVAYTMIYDATQTSHQLNIFFKKRKRLGNKSSHIFVSEQSSSPVASKTSATKCYSTLCHYKITVTYISMNMFLQSRKKNSMNLITARRSSFNQLKLSLWILLWFVTVMPNIRTSPNF